MKYRRILLLGLLSLLGCQSTAPVYNAEILEIDENKIGEYWIFQPPTGKFRWPEGMPFIQGKWTYSAIIDSTGHEYELILISSTPEHFMTQVRLEKWIKQKYIAAPTNVDRVPVKTILHGRFDL